MNEELSGRSSGQKLRWFGLQPEHKPWLIAALVVLTASWAADGLREMIDPLLTGNKPDVAKLVPCIVYLILFGMCVWLLYRIRQEIFAPRTRLVRNETPEPREHLILFLSELPEKGKFNDGIPDGITLTGDLDKDLQNLVQHKRINPYWPWEMALRGIKHHLTADTLKSVIVICSPESIAQVHHFGEVLCKYSVLERIDVKIFVKEPVESKFIKCPTEPITKGGWIFEEFDDLSNAVMHLLRELKRQEVEDEQIMLDFTSGQKVTSVVAAAVTFNRNIKAQYVQTKGPHNVIGYDIVLGSSETGGLGF
ncbi:MAG: hypothetical protein MN733_21430 [Nitrososphaera sp.]|nr:hypothetical protein [Nitrososphaera sp.]